MTDVGHFLTRAQAHRDGIRLFFERKEPSNGFCEVFESLNVTGKCDSLRRMGPFERNPILARPQGSLWAVPRGAYRKNFFSRTNESSMLDAGL